MSQINFLPASYRERAESARRRPLNFLAIGITAAALAGVWVLGDRSSVLAHQADTLSHELTLVENEQAAANDLRRQIAQVQRDRALAREISQPVTTAQVLATLAEVMPPSVKLTSVQVVAHRPEPAKPTAPVAAGSQSTDTPDAPRTHEPVWLELSVMGIAPTQQDIVQLTAALTHHPLFTQVRPRSSGATQTDRFEARTFHLALRIDLDREFVPADPAPAETGAQR